MNESQRDSVYAYLYLNALAAENTGVEIELHHGNCVGVDVEVAKIAKELGYRLVAHPGPKGKYYSDEIYINDEVRPSRGYLDRNRDIVNETNFLLVVPFEDTHQDKGGTWYTHDYAVKKGKSMRVFYPNKMNVVSTPVDIFKREMR